MNKEIISDKQGICLVTMFILGSTLLLGTGGGIAKKDAWMAVIVGILYAAPVLYIYSRLMSKFHGHDLFDILQLIFGKFFGKVISILYIWFAFHLGSLVERNFSDFTETAVYPDTPVQFPLLFFVLLFIWGVKLGIENLGRWSEIYILVVTFLLVAVTIFLSLPQLDFNNIRPIFYNGIKPILHSGFLAFSFPFGETVIFLMVFSSLKTKKSSYKVFFMGLIFGGIFILIVSLRNLLIIGAESMSRDYFPSYVAVSAIKIGDFIQRLELAVSTVLLLNVFIKVSICLLAVCKGLQKVFDLDDYRFLVTPMALLMTSFSMIVYPNIMESVRWAFKIWPFYAFFFQAILPLIIFIFGEIKFRKVI